MSRIFSKKFLLSIMIGIFFISFIFATFFAYNFYRNIFRLSEKEVNSSLNNKRLECISIKKCTLLPGDILIRKYTTKRTWLIEKIANPYFTHSAMYLGNDQIIEAIGNEKNSKDDIQIDTLSKSDWMDTDIEKLIIIRPLNINTKFTIIKENLENIAKDPDYTFGLPKQGNKKTTCSELIFEQLKNEDLLPKEKYPELITPDYLFYIATNNNYFKIIVVSR